MNEVLKTIKGEIYEKDDQTVIAEKKESDLKQKNREETGSRQLSCF